MRRVHMVLAAVAALVPHLSAAAASPGWDQKENIEEAARHIADMHLKQGAQKAVSFIDACYRTHSLAADYSRAYEACIVRDYILAQALAGFYTQLPQEERTRRNLPEPGAITNVMGHRVAAAFKHYGISPGDAEAFRQLVEKHGFPLFMGIVFPEAVKKPGETPDRKKKSDTRDKP